MDGHTRNVTDAARLLELQRAAQRKEGLTSARARIDRLYQLEDMVRKRADSIADAISADFGNRSRFETDLLETMVLVSAIRHARKNVKWWMQPSYREVGFNFWPGSAWVRPEPLGIVGIVSPWNYPLLQTSWKVAPVEEDGTLITRRLRRSQRDRGTRG